MVSESQMGKNDRLGGFSDETAPKKATCLTDGGGQQVDVPSLGSPFEASSLISSLQRGVSCTSKHMG